MSEQTISFLFQMPLAGVIVYLVYLFLQYIQRMFEKMMAFMKEQAEINREFLRTQREQSNAAIARLAEEQKMMREEQAKTTMVIDRLVTLLTPSAQKKNRNV